MWYPRIAGVALALMIGAANAQLPDVPPDWELEIDGELMFLVLKDANGVERKRQPVRLNLSLTVVDVGDPPPPPPPPPVDPQCSDGADNDGDGLIDSADPGCSDANDDDESDDPPPPPPPPVDPQCSDGADNDDDGLVDLDDPGCEDAGDDDESDPDDPPPPPPPPSNLTYPPMSTSGGLRYEFMKRQFNTFYKNCDFAGNVDCWRYDPMKTLFEFAERVRLVEGDGAFYREVLNLATDVSEAFVDRWPLTGGPGVWPGRDRDSKVNGHASAHLYLNRTMTAGQAEDLARFCFNQGWRTTRLDSVIQTPAQIYTERHTGLGIQCLVDLARLGFDTRDQLKAAIDAQHAMITGGFSGRVIGAPMHSINGHECSGNCGSTDYWNSWMFSPWMGSSFLIPALWEYWLFVDQDPKIPEMAIAFAKAMVDHGIKEFPDPRSSYNGPYARGSRSWEDNPTPWVTLYGAMPGHPANEIRFQNADGASSDQHNPEAMFALALGWYFGCDAEVKQRLDEMWPYFTNGEGSRPPRRFLWQHRGSASTEWLLENASCN